MLQKIKGFAYWFCIPVFCVVFYFVFCMALTALPFTNSALRMFVGDSVAAIVYGVFFYRLCIKTSEKPEEKYKLNGVSIFLLSVSFLFPAIISSVMFALMHGTTEHIPMAMALSFFICFVYELTGRFLLCVLIHICSNLVSMAYIFQIPFLAPVFITLYVVYIIIIFALCAGVDKLRPKMQYRKDKPTFTSKLEEKRKHWADISLDTDVKDDSNGSENV